MKKTILLALLLPLLTPGPVIAQEDGFHKISSPHPVTTTVAKLKAVLSDKGMNIFATIDHRQGAIEAGLELRPTTLVIFGNPKVGTKLMQCDPRAGLALPLKILIWEDEAGKVWLGYREPPALAGIYGLEACAEVLARMKNAMANFARAATL